MDNYDNDLFPSTTQRKRKSPSASRQAEDAGAVKPKEKRISLTPIQFLSDYHYVVEKITDVLSKEYGSRLTEDKFRSDIEYDTRDEVLKILEENECRPVKELEVPYLKLIYADIMGLGVLEQLLADKEVDEIMVVNYDDIYVEKHGQIQKTDLYFPSYENALNKVKKIITPLNKTIDTAHPNVDAQLPDGSRLSATIPPLRAKGAISIDIRKFKGKVEPLIYYSEHYKSSTPEMCQFIQWVVESRLSFIVSGGTGSGKTTTLNSCSLYIPETERVITIEDTLELQLQQDNWEAYQTVDKNVEGTGGFTTQDIVKMALRKRPDRIIVGECRGGEFVEMLNAMNTGHDGSMSTIHANDPKDMLQRAKTMVLSNPDTKNLNDEAIYHMIESAIDIIIQVKRLEDGARRIVNITEVVGYGEDGFRKLQEKGILGPKATPRKDQLYVQDIFQFKQTTTDEDGTVHGEFRTTGYIPVCVEKLRERGINVSDSFFAKRVLMEV